MIPYVTWSGQQKGWTQAPSWSCRWDPIINDLHMSKVFFKITYKDVSNSCALLLPNQFHIVWAVLPRLHRHHCWRDRLDSATLALPRTEECFGLVEQDAILDYKLPCRTTLAGKILKHCFDTIDGLLEAQKPCIFKFGFTHCASFRWHNTKFGYRWDSSARWSNMLILYAASEYISPAFVESALIQRHKGFLHAKKINMNFLSRMLAFFYVHVLYYIFHYISGALQNHITQDNLDAETFGTEVKQPLGKSLAPFLSMWCIAPLKHRLARYNISLRWWAEGKELNMQCNRLSIVFWFNSICFFFGWSPWWFNHKVVGGNRAGEEQSKKIVA